MTMTSETITAANQVLTRLAPELQRYAEQYAEQSRAGMTAAERASFHRTVTHQYEIAGRIAATNTTEDGLRRAWTIIGNANREFDAVRQRRIDNPQTYGDVWTREAEQRTASLVSSAMPVVAAVSEAATGLASGLGALALGVVALGAVIIAGKK